MEEHRARAVELDDISAAAKIGADALSLYKIIAGRSFKKAGPSWSLQGQLKSLLKHIRLTIPGSTAQEGSESLRRR